MKVARREGEFGKIDLVEGEIDGIDVAPVDVVLDFGIGEKNLGDVEGEGRFDDLIELGPGIIDPLRFALAEFGEEALVEFDGFGVVVYGADKFTEFGLHNTSVEIFVGIRGPQLEYL